MIERVSGVSPAPFSRDVSDLSKKLHHQIRSLISAIQAQDLDNIASSVLALDPLCKEVDQC